MTTEQKLLDACVDYRAKLDVLEAENTALRTELAALRAAYERMAEKAAARKEAQP